MTKSSKILGAAALLALIVAPAALAASTITRGQVSDLDVTGAAPVFTAALTVAGGRASTSTDPGRGVWWNLTVTIKSGSTASKVYLRKLVDTDGDGDTDATLDEVLNADANLTAGARYGFSFQVHPDHTWNVVLGTTTHLATLQVEEEP